MYFFMVWKLIRELLLLSLSDVPCPDFLTCEHEFSRKCLSTPVAASWTGIEDRAKTMTLVATQDHPSVQ